MEGKGKEREGEGMEGTTSPHTLPPLVSPLVVVVEISTLGHVPQATPT